MLDRCYEHVGSPLRRGVGRLAGEDGAVRVAVALPVMGPQAIVKVEAGLVVGAAESVVEGELAGGLVELEQEHAIVGGQRGRGYDQALHDGIPCGPVRHIGVGDFEARDFDGLGGIGDVENDQAMNGGNALHKVVSDDGGDAAPIAGKGEGEMGDGLIGVDGGDVFETAAESLHEDRAIRSAARLFGTNLGIAIFADIEVGSFEQLEIGQAPDLIRDAGKDVVIVHGRVSRDDAIDFGEDDQAVRSEECVGERRVGVAGGANDFAVVVDFDESTGFAAGRRLRGVAHGAHGMLGVLEGGEDIAVGQAKVGMRMHVAGHVGEGRDGFGMERITKIEDEGATGVVIVGEEHATGGHGVFGVMDADGLLVGGEGGEQLAIRGRGGVGVDHGEKVVALVGEVASPGKEVMRGWRGRMVLRRDGWGEGTNEQG